MPYTTGTLQPLQVAQLRCPRCWFAGAFVPDFSLQFRCIRCEWLFTFAASTPPVPAVPAATVGYTNVSGSPMAVTISAGTVSSVVVNGVQAGTADGTYYVPVAGVISITYTSTPPTWAWALPTVNGALTAGGTSIPVSAGGTAYAYGQALIIDTGGTWDLVTVSGTPTGTAIPCTALAASHLTGRSISVAQLTPAFSAVGEQGIPQNTY